MLKYKKDTRYSLEDVISTHDRSELAAKPVEQLEEVRALLDCLTCEHLCPARDVSQIVYP